jgi:hypothetical protein
MPRELRIPVTLRRFASKIEDIEDARAVDNGWWVYLKPGWIWQGETHQIHEDTLKDCAEAFDFVERCGCEECKGVDS